VRAVVPGLRRAVPGHGGDRHLTTPVLCVFAGPRAGLAGTAAAR